MAWDFNTPKYLFIEANTEPSLECNRRRPAAADAVVNGSRAARRQLFFWERAMAATDAVTSGRPAVVAAGGLLC